MLENGAGGVHPFRRSSSSEGSMLPPSGSFRSGHAMRPVQPPGTGNSSARGPVPPQMRKGPSFRDAAHKVTLSESIRNNSKIQDELQAKINQQARELEDMREQLAKKEEDAQKRAKEMNERMEANKREAEELRDKERASEMAIRRLEEEIRLLRKQHNEIDKAWRRSDDKGGARAPTPKENASREGGARPPIDLQRVDSSGSELKSLRKQLAAAEAEVADARAKLDAARQELDKLKKVPDNSGAYKEQISKLSQTIKEVQGKLDKKEAEAASLSSQLASAKKQIQELLASAGKGNQEDVNRRAQLEKALAEAEQQLSKTRAKLSAAEIEARKASEAKAKADAEADDAVRLLAIAKKDKADLEEQVKALNKQVSGFEESAAVLEGQVRKRDETIAELREQISKLEGAAGSEADEAKKECERLKMALEDKDEEAQSKDKELCKLRDELAAEKLAREAETSASNGKINGLEKEVGDLREQLKGYDGADKESLARLCRIRELEEEVRKEMAESAQIAGQRDALRSEVKSANELKVQAVRDLGIEKAKFEGEKRAWQSREAALKSEIEALSLNLNKGPAKEIKQEELDHVKKKLELQTSMHRLQMLLRMAEVTKLEEHIKCQRRADNVKEEKIGLLTYNLASAESQISGESDEATKKRADVRGERMAALNKRQKTEEDKMRTNEESYNQQSKKLKEKLVEREREFKALA